MLARISKQGKSFNPLVRTERSKKMECYLDFGVRVYDFLDYCCARVVVVERNVTVTWFQRKW